MSNVARCGLTICLTIILYTCQKDHICMHRGLVGWQIQASKFPLSTWKNSEAGFPIYRFPSPGVAHIHTQCHIFERITTFASAAAFSAAALLVFAFSVAAFSDVALASASAFAFASAAAFASAMLQATAFEMHPTSQL